MSESVKPQNFFWWIASIAVSVLCCAVLFVVFAVYLCDVKSSIKANEDNIALIQQREDRILAEIELLRKNSQISPTQDSSASPAPDSTAGGGTPPALPEAAPANAVPPTVAPAPVVPTTVAPAPVVPTTVAPSASVTVPTVLAVPPTAAGPAPTNPVPQVSLPSITSPADKK